MRTIKFRVWKSWRKPEMLYPPSFDLKWTEKEKSQGMIYKDEPSTYRADCNWQFDTSWNMPVMQFTGLFDKNGKELYFDDIVNLRTKDNPYRVVHDDFGVPCFVSPKNYLHCIDFTQYFSEMGKHDFEIIGNIHENPELLESK